ncbi:MAG: sigma-54-dependent Fis family transcriptional regulator [Nitrospirae bacterium]|nr:sigma-54-dependent Fis family transcriptional regulator [Nitrospirota bacterium]
MPESNTRNNCPAVLIVDDEKQILLSFSMLLKSSGIGNVITIEDSRDVMPVLAQSEVSVVVLDLTMPHLPGTELLPMIHADYPGIPVIVMSGMNDITTAVDCMRSGAVDYLVKPVEISRFISSVKQAVEMCSLRNEAMSLKNYLLNDTLNNAPAFSSIITNSRRMRGIFQYAEVVAKTPQPVLVTGETGVGKELIARCIHDLSGRHGAFVEVNAAGLDDMVFSDTLFGHRKGAFTGADTNREGLIAKAADGTLFLDEIGDMTKPSQVKLLRLLQEGSYYPLGSDTQKRSTARIIAATNQNLETAMERGDFRKDLYYRLKAHQVQIPPLRDRSEDIPLLIDYFTILAAESFNRQQLNVSSELKRRISAYAFPGNVRELRAVVFDAVARNTSGALTVNDFGALFGETPQTEAKFAPAQSGPPDRLVLPEQLPTLREARQQLITEALSRAEGNQGVAASWLGITRQALNKYLSRRNDQPED